MEPGGAEAGLEPLRPPDRPMPRGIVRGPEADTMSTVRQAKLSLFVIIVMSMCVSVLLAYGIDQWLFGNTVKAVGQGLLAAVCLAAVLLHARIICGLVR